jgi:hypothetical protein
MKRAKQNKRVKMRPVVLMVLELPKGSLVVKTPNSEWMSES